MVFKIKTSKKTMEIFETVGATEQLQPFILAKIAISLSIKTEAPLTETDFRRDNNGLELNRQTITGEFDVLFKCLIEMKENQHLDDEAYLKKYLKAHLDRGATIMQQEHKYGRNFFEQLINEDSGI